MSKLDFTLWLSGGNFVAALYMLATENLIQTIICLIVSFALYYVWRLQNDK